jgi:cellobiose phosphorylase
MTKEVMKVTVNNKWKFTDEVGSFEWINPHAVNELYFPICNEAGMMASVTPRLHGDATSGQHTFLRRPLVMEDLHNTRSARNFWIYSDALGAYSLTGGSARQLAESYQTENRVQTTVRGTFLSHTLIREDLRAGIRSEIEIFSPVTDDKIEIARVRITNLSNSMMRFVPTSAFPVYCRSADSLRDHNHWTSLSHRMKLNDFGMVIKPELHHDESGHKPNFTNYFVLAVGGAGDKPVGQFPTVYEFIGDSNFDWPEAVVKNLAPYTIPPHRRDGMESVGAIRFAEKSLVPGETCEYIVIEGASEDEASILRCIERYGDREKVQLALDENLAFWKEKIRRIDFQTGDAHFDRWMHWVALQPTLRKLYGNSFLPHFDYGKGGRGWRDLWQDCLALLLQNPGEMKESLVANFNGVRLDGSNATIIRKELGEFAADRNKISRVWMDHGVWPFFTLKLYVDQTGDFDVISIEGTYWKDHQIRRAKAHDANWKSSVGVWQKMKDGEIYKGSVIEHVLVQHLTCFCNVGEHNNMKLEDADWNDLLDLANQRGESVPFSAFYGHNLISIAELLLKYGEVSSVEDIPILEDLLLLTGIELPLDYESYAAKQGRLEEYYLRLERGFSGKKKAVPIKRLSEELTRMGQWVLEHVRDREWIESKTGHGFFNGYYNNDGQRVDGDCEDGPRMNLTAQTFAIMSGAATDQQVRRAYGAVRAILVDPKTGGYRLTTPLGPNRWNFGRGFAVVYGEKETGGSFNHMIVMFLNGLYRRGFVKEGYEVFSSIYRLANDTERAKIYPGISEYISSEGQAKYHYLSGSASWLLMTVLTQIFGIRGEYGDLLLHPKLVKVQFDEKGYAVTRAMFLGRRIVVTYCNPNNLDYGDYKIEDVSVNGARIEVEAANAGPVRIGKERLDDLLLDSVDNELTVTLDWARPSAERNREPTLPVGSRRQGAKISDEAAEPESKEG